MDDTTIATRCIDIIAKSKALPPTSITPDSTFEELLIDSLDKINISFDIEEAFNISIPDDSLNSLKTVGDIIRGVTSLVHTAPAITATPTP